MIIDEISHTTPLCRICRCELFDEIRRFENEENYHIILNISPCVG